MTPTEDSIKYPANTKQGYMTAREGDGLVTSRPCLARGTVQPGTAPTLTGCDGCGTGAVVKKDGVLKVRELTPLECWRLMGQTDEAYYRAAESTRRTFKNGNVSKPSKTALYKAAGNSIVVDVLVDIFEAMYKGKNWITPGCVKPGIPRTVYPRVAFGGRGTVFGHRRATRGPRTHGDPLRDKGHMRYGPPRYQDVQGDI